MSHCPALMRQGDSIVHIYQDTGDGLTGGYFMGLLGDTLVWCQLCFTGAKSEFANLSRVGNAVHAGDWVKHTSHVVRAYPIYGEKGKQKSIHWDIDDVSCIHFLPITAPSGAVRFDGSLPVLPITAPFGAVRSDGSQPVLPITAPFGAVRSDGSQPVLPITAPSGAVRSDGSQPVLPITCDEKERASFTESDSNQLYGLMHAALGRFPRVQKYVDANPTEPLFAWYKTEHAKRMKELDEFRAGLDYGGF